MPSGAPGMKPGATEVLQVRIVVVVLVAVWFFLFAMHGAGGFGIPADPLRSIRERQRAVNDS